MKCLVATVAIGLSCSLGLCQDVHAYRTCSNAATSQAELNQCASEETKRVDAELNAIYTKLLAELSKNPAAAAKVKAERSAWINYRNAYVDAMYPEENKQAAYGSIFPMEVDLLYAILTREQIKDMSNLRRSFKPNY